MSEVKELSLSTNLSDLPGVSQKINSTFEKLSLKTVEDLIYHLPVRIEDYSTILPIARVVTGKTFVISGQIEKISSRTTKKGVLMIDAKIVDSTGKISALWFNQRFLLSILKKGSWVTLVGEKKAIKALNYPFFVKKIISKADRYPIYSSTKGLKQYQFTRIFERVRNHLDLIEDTLPNDLKKLFGLKDKQKLLIQAHYEKEADQIQELKNYLSTEELLSFALAIKTLKSQEAKVVVKPLDILIDQIKRFIDDLPFTIAPEQKKATWEIMTDLKKDQPMNRLLYGEVGSGKTLIAALVSLVALSNRKSVVFLAPTVALAHQQTTVLKEMFRNTPYSIVTHTSNKKEKINPNSLIVSTHSLLYSAEDISDLAIIIIDEQHRFGVSQRQQLIKKYPLIHSLMMTATPIPRSLTQTVFRFLDITYLGSNFKNRTPVLTTIFDETNRTTIYQEIQKKLDKKEPGYVICPLINEQKETDGEWFQVKKSSILSEEKRLKKEFPQAIIATIHGKMTALKKQETIEDFRAQKIDILLSTTVVEVGIDNPAASWIVIENADHFGLAQLHQLRGRVGRGDNKSHCYLHNSQTTVNGQERLDILTKLQDGIELSEFDLKMRGPGDIIGENQSGLPNFKFADLSNLTTVEKIFSYAEKMSLDKLDDLPEIKSKMQSYLKETNEISRG